MNTIPPPIQFTPAAYQKLQARQKELFQLQSEVVQRLQTAREMGDLSENGAYKYAKFELGNVRRELGQVNHSLKYGIVTAIKQHYEKIEFGCTFTIHNDKKTITGMLVSAHESDPAQGKLSIESPIGQAVFSKKVGDVVRIQSPSGEQEFTVTKIA